MAHKEAQVALLNVMQKEVTRIVLFEEWDSEFHIFVKQMRAQNRGRPDVKLARLCLQMATTLFGEELGRGYEMRRDSGADGDGGGDLFPEMRRVSAAHDIGRNSYDTDGEDDDDEWPMTTSTRRRRRGARPALARMSQFQALGGADSLGRAAADTYAQTASPAPTTRAPSTRASISAGKSSANPCAREHHRRQPHHDLPVSLAATAQARRRAAPPRSPCAARAPARAGVYARSLPREAWGGRRHRERRACSVRDLSPPPPPPVPVATCPAGYASSACRPLAQLQNKINAYYDYPDGHAMHEDALLCELEPAAARVVSIKRQLPTKFPVFASLTASALCCPSRTRLTRSVFGVHHRAGQHERLVQYFITRGEVEVTTRSRSCSAATPRIPVTPAATLREGAAAAPAATATARWATRKRLRSPCRAAPCRGRRSRHGAADGDNAASPPNCARRRRHRREKISCPRRGRRDRSNSRRRRRRRTTSRSSPSSGPVRTSARPCSSG